MKRKINFFNGTAGMRMMLQESKLYTLRAVWLACIVLTTLCALPAHAQKYLGSLNGEVSDTTGAKISGATVTVTGTTTKFTTKARSNGSGAYSIPFLNPDTYNVSVEAPTFRSETRTGIIVTAGDAERADFTLSVGSQSEMVTVSASGAPLDVSSASLSTTFTAKEVTDLPNLGRVPFMVAALAAGAYDNGYIAVKTDTTLVPWGGGATATVGGDQQNQTRVTIDGIPDDPQERGATYTGLTPSPESVQEVKIQTALYDAEYGRGGGTVINTVLRSGTNAFHGAAYYVFRNTYMDANYYERVPNQEGAINPASPTHRNNETWNQPGFVLSGPARIPHIYDGRDKTYFMVAYERVQLRGTEIPGATDFVPTAAEANGDFSALCPGGFNVNGVCNAGGGVQIYDPLTLDANNNRTPFPNNQIPKGRFSAVGTALLKAFPAPNANISPFINYLSTRPTIPSRYYSVTTRIDHSINQNNKWTATFYNQLYNSVVTNQGFPTAIGPPNTDAHVYRNNHGGSLDFISILPRNWVLDARIGVIYHPFGVVHTGNPYDISSLGISSTGLAYQTFPGISFSDSYTGLQGGSGSQVSEDTLGSAALIISKVVGRHDMRFGFEGELHRYNAAIPTSGLGNFSFDRRFTQKNSVNVRVGGDASSGNPIASLLLGYPSAGGYSINPEPATQLPYQAYFFQDDWRVSQKLTFNMGLRWDFQGPFTERYNQLNTGFCTTCTNPLQNSVANLTLLGGLQFASSSHRSYYATHYNQFQPRFGASYELNPRVVLHAGAGLIYWNTYEATANAGFSSATDYVATTDNTHPATSFANPFPNGVNLPTGSSAGLSTQIGQSVAFMAPNYVIPRTLEWTASTQTELPRKMTLQVAYVGTRGYDLGVNNNINHLPVQYFNQGPAGITYLQTQVPNPMAGKIPTNGALNGATIQRQLLLNPFPEFGSVTELSIPVGGTLYNSLQVTARKPMSHNLSLIGTFTWSKSIRATFFNNATDTTPVRFEDPNIPSLLGNIAVEYQLPRFSASPRYERAILGGWQFNGVLRAYNGLLINNPGGFKQLSSPRIGNPTDKKYFNTCYLNQAGQPVLTTPAAPGCDSPTQTPAFQQLYAFTLNTINPVMSGVRVREHPLVDASLFKVFPIHESLTFEIRGEFFNVLNTPNFAGPNFSPGNVAYGSVTLVQQNNPRIGQLTARINF